jgi:hypothetical protein
MSRLAGKLKNAKVVQAASSGFRADAFRKALPVAAGRISHTIVSRTIVAKLPAQVQTPLGIVIVNLTVAGLLSAGTFAVTKNKDWSTAVLIGGMLDTITGVAYQVVLPAMGLSGIRTPTF